MYKHENTELLSHYFKGLIYDLTISCSFGLSRESQDYIKNMELYKITVRLLGNIFSIAILLRLHHMAQKRPANKNR
jgi:hypothetical protein